MKRKDVLALFILALAVVWVYGQVLFTNRIPASGDFLFYFAPYWDYANQALRAGRLPLWNPDIYAGAPFLANPQTQLFYPLRWLFVFVSTEKGILIFAALHAWLAGAFTYALARKIGPVRPLAALVAALLFALNGWTTGLLAHPVRWGNVPWLPAAILLWEMRPPVWRWNAANRRWGVALAGVWTLSLLAGHTQTFYNQVVIFGAWVFAPLLWQGLKRAPMNADEHGQKTAHSRSSAFICALYGWGWLLGPPLLALALVFTLVLLLSAVQLLPTFELASYSYRSGGLPFRDHAALSLPPWRLALTLLPHYGRNLGQAFGSDAFGEWVATIGWVGLLLAGLGLRRGRGRLRLPAAVLVVAGLILSFGAYTPLDILFYHLFPGWNLFRVPARWLEAAMLGFALLAALGLDSLVRAWPWPAIRFRHSRPVGGESLEKPPGTPLFSSLRLGGRFIWGAKIGLLLLALALILFSRPTLLTLALWLGTGFIVAAAFWLGQRRWTWGAAVLVLLMLLELVGASWSLPIQHPTAPQALRSWRTAPARIAAENQPLCRTLSLSTTTYDPGDLAELRQIYGPELDDWALSDLINATKAKEVLAPNLGMIYHIPSLDGFGGGVLPTRYFVQSMGLLLPPQQVVADGRLRETLRSVPDARLLSLLGVCYVITDKDFDAWVDGVYYDLAFGEALTPTQPDLQISPLPLFPVTSIGLISYLQGGAALSDGEPVAELFVSFADGRQERHLLRAGEHTAEGSDQTPGVEHRRHLPAVPWRYHAAGHDTVATVPLVHTGPLGAVSIRLLRDDVSLFVRGIAFRDAVSNAHTSPPVSRHPWQRIHSGDVKIYRNNAVMSGATFIPHAELSPDDALTLAAMQSPHFDPRQTVYLARGGGGDGGSGEVDILQWTPETIRLHTRAATAGTLLVADAWYPGWQATVDGEPVSVQRADLLLRAVAVPAGSHELIMRFRPRSLRWGAGISLLGLFLALVLLLMPQRPRRNS